MEFLTNLTPEIQLVIITAVGGLALLLVNLAFGKVKKLADKTETEIDNQIAAKLEILAEKTVKDTMKKLTAEAEAKKTEEQDTGE